MPPTLEQILDSAHTQWEFWGNSTWHVVTNQKQIGHTDDETPFAQHVIESYCSVGGGAPSLVDIADDRYFWSAVGMSAIMSAAGFLRAEFDARAAASYGRSIVITGDVHLSQCAGFVVSPSALSSDNLTMYCPSGSV